MILIADSGSTKTSWCLTDKNNVIFETITPGINPYFQSEEDIDKEIAQIMLSLNTGINRIKAVFFYGAGCTSDKKNMLEKAISNHIVTEHIEIGSDLLGTARAVCGKEAGIACILGTGSNSCYYNGSAIEHNIAPLGFILGDEGSGAFLGKRLIGDLLKDMLPGHLKEKFFTRFNLTPSLIIDNVYRQPFPNRFLASFTPFLFENIHEPDIYQLIFQSFCLFFERNVKKYNYTKYRVHFIGSIAFHFKEILLKAAEKSGIRTGSIQLSPMEGLIKFHTT